MKPERILVPIDTARCRPEVFSRVNAFAGNAGVTIILLHVVNLNVVPMGSGQCEMLAAEAHWHLQQMVVRYIDPDIMPLVHVRIGKPVEEILVEAKAENVDLIMVPIPRKANEKLLVSLWRGLFGLGERLLRGSPCPVQIVHAETCFNCQERWGLQAEGNGGAPYYLEAASKSGTPAAASTTENSLAESETSRQFAA
jgi:nucleotide-binding universal stress UspA family protein